MLTRQIFSSILRSQRHLPRFVAGSRNFSENDSSTSSSSSDSDSELESSTDSSVKEMEDVSTNAYILPSRSDGFTAGTFFQMPKNLFDRLYGIYGFEPYQKELFEVLDDTGIMIRDPYFQLVDYINKTNFDLPANRYVLYGRYGTGKTFTLNSMAHYGYHHNFVIVQLSSPHEWINEPHEMELSETRPGRLDYPLNAALALKHFKSQNSAILKRLNLRTTKKYTWSIRETTEKGDPLVNVVDHGIGRMKHSSDCYAVLLKELKLLANSGACKLMVLCDSINVLYDKPKVKHPDGRVVSVEEVTLSRAFMKLLQHDWKNGLLIASTNKKTNSLPLRLDSYFPKHLLTDRGFEDLDPFIPIEVKDYSEIEVDSCLDYYTQRNFLNRPPAKTKAGRDEIKFLTANNPQEVYKFCSAL